MHPRALFVCVLFCLFVRVFACLFVVTHNLGRFLHVIELGK
jgi:hypothetical protein